MGHLLMGGVMNHTELERLAGERLATIEGVLAVVEKPGPVPIGAPGSIMRRAWDLGRTLERSAREKRGP